jgi:peptidoglycan/LPS O-acetylase OafA/YrhL
VPIEVPKASSGYLPTLDGWRALAILLVIGSHDRLYRIGNVTLSWFHPIAGEYGVALFFALSGLLICSRLLQEERVRGHIDLKGFYIRRFCRIQPAALVYLFTVCVLIGFGAIDRANNGVLSALLFARNYTPGSNGDSWYTAHFWSLSIEEHFYFFMPALLVLLRRFRVAVLVVLFVVIESLRRLADVQSPHTDLEGGIILLGALAAVLLARPAFRIACLRWLRPWAVLPLVIALWILLWLHNSGYNYIAFVLSLPLLIVSTMLHPESAAGRILEMEPFKFVGRISYSLYLWQQMFFASVEHWQPVQHNNALTWLQHSWPRYFILPAIAIASYYWVEKPLIRLGHRLARPATPGREDLNEVPAAANGAIAS